MSIGRVPGTTGIQPSIVTAKGDLIVATASGSVTNQAVGSNNQVLTADSAQADGVKWANGSAATLTTTGDLLYASAANTPARLGIGSTNQVLTVSGGVPSWATPSSGALTLISTTTLSSVASQSFNSVFTSTYRNYQVLINVSGTATSINFLGLRFRASSTDATTGYQGRMQSLNTNATGSTSFDYNDQSSTYIPLGYLKWNSDPQLSGLINITNPQVAQASGVGGIMTGGDAYGVAPLSSLSMGILANTTAYDGFTLYPTAGGNLNGVVSIYGVSK